MFLTLFKDIKTFLYTFLQMIIPSKGDWQCLGQTLNLHKFWSNKDFHMIFYSRESWNFIFLDRRNFCQKFLEHSRIFYKFRKICFLGWGRQNRNFGLQPEWVRVIDYIFCLKEFWCVWTRRNFYIEISGPVEYSTTVFLESPHDWKAKKIDFSTFLKMWSRWV